MENVIVKNERGSFCETGFAEATSRSQLSGLPDANKLIGKRVLDVAVALLAIFFVMSWLFPIVALAIKLTSKGPILFKQRRHGLHNRPFDCYKFRTMVINNDADTRQATKGDRRVTKVGRILRVTSIDELPQLFNVLKGEMAIVGPRPHAIPMNLEFSKEIEDFMFRHTVKPGITGLAQVKGYRGEIRNFYDIYRRYKLDVFYARKWCLIFDVKIIFETFGALLVNRDRAY